MKKSAYLFVIILLTSHVTQAQFASGKFQPDTSKVPLVDFNDWSYKLSTTISKNDIREHIFTLASDEMQGRETGAEGNDKAAAYIADHFKKLRLPTIGENNTYFQKVAFTFSSWKSFEIQHEDEEYKLMRDFIAFPQFSSDDSYGAKEIVYAGYGIEEGAYNDYAGADVTNKVVIIYDGEPISNDGISGVTGTKETSNWSSDWKLKSELAKAKGAKALIIIANNFKNLAGQNRRNILNRVTELGDMRDRANGVNTIMISSTMAKALLGESTNEIIALRDAIKEKKGLPLSITIPCDITINQVVSKDVLEGQNILGYVEGTDLKDEVIVVSGHYDHVGFKGDEVYNGADDNASGTTTVMEICEALQTSKLMGYGPRRSILCLLVTGEEKGLLGSDYYSANPYFPLEATVADVNIDMQGRWGEEYLDESQVYNYVIGSDRISQDLHDINEEVNQKYSHILLDYKYNDERDPNRFYFRSDHYNFAKHGIPSIFFFNGVHDDYHRLTDEPEKIDIDLMEKRGRQIFHLVWELANRDDRIRLNGPGQ